MSTRIRDKSKCRARGGGPGSKAKMKSGENQKEVKSAEQNVEWNKMK